NSIPEIDFVACQESSVVRSAFIPIPQSVVQRLHTDLAADEKHICTEHFFAWDRENQLGVLTCLRCLQNEWERTYFFSVFDQHAALRCQYDLPTVADTVEVEDRLYPRAIEFGQGGHILVGGSSSYNADDNFLSGLYVVDVEH